MLRCTHCLSRLGGWLQSREEKTLHAVIEKGMPEGEQIVFKYAASESIAAVHEALVELMLSPC